MQCIALWNKCNNKCLMCSNPPNYDKWGDYSFETLVSRIKKINQGEDSVYLTGGEPTLNPNFFELLFFLRKRCPGGKIVLDTNGRVFAYKAFLKKILSCGGNIEFQVSLCGHNSLLHDMVAGTSGSFNQTSKGIANIILFRKHRFNELEIRVVVHGLNVLKLKDIFEFVFKNFYQIDRLVFIFMEMEGQAGKNIKKIGVSYKKAAPHLKSLLKKILKSKPLFEVRFYHFPLCALPSWFWPYIWRTLPKEEVVFLDCCNKCLQRKNCLGIHKDYIKYFGEKEFNPIIKEVMIKKTNNFYHPIATVGSE